MKILSIYKIEHNIENIIQHNLLNYIFIIFFNLFQKFKSFIVQSTNSGPFKKIYILFNENLNISTDFFSPTFQKIEMEFQEVATL